MCLLAILFRAVPDAHLVLGANREEAYARGGEPPAVREGPVPFVAGLDPAAGGTWLGVNAHGLLVAVTNRPKLQPPAQPRSRGLLARDLLGCPSAAAAVERATAALDSGLYAGCNFLLADRERAVVIHAADWLRVRPLPPGVHVLTNNDVNNESDRRLAYALGWLAGRPHDRAAECVASLKELCGQRGDGGPPIVLRGDGRGTVSSTVLTLTDPPGRGTYLHAQGPPDTTPYADYSALLRQLPAPAE